MPSRNRRQNALTHALKQQRLRINGLTIKKIKDPPKVRMIDRRIPTIATGNRSNQLFPAGTLANDSWNQPPPGRGTIRLTAAQRNSIIPQISLNRARLLSQLTANNRLNLLPRRARRAAAAAAAATTRRCRRACQRQRFPFV